MVLFKPICSRTRQVAPDRPPPRQPIWLLHPDGNWVKAGDLIVGNLYEVDLDTGHVRPVEKEKS